MTAQIEETKLIVMVAVVVKSEYRLNVGKCLQLIDLFHCSKSFIVRIFSGLVA